jgi:hypothetical protein
LKNTRAPGRPSIRQSLADTIWGGYVTARFGRTGDTRAFDYLYPYLNHADRVTQLRAIRVVGSVFEGRGVRALDAIQYITHNPRHFLRDRAVTVVGSTLKGTRVRLMLPVMIPYLESRNTFTKKLAVAAIGIAAEGTARADVLDLNETHGKAWPHIQKRAIARVFAGKPNEDIYARLVEGENRDEDLPVVIEGAGMDWFERANADVFEPLAKTEVSPKKPFWMGIYERAAVTGISRAGAGLGMAALSKMIHLARRR